MKKNDVFKFTAPNGAEVTAAVVDCIYVSDDYRECYLCYAQNRLFNYTIYYDFDWVTGEPTVDKVYEGVVCNYCIIPELDTLLMDHRLKTSLYVKVECFDPPHETCEDCHAETGGRADMLFDVKYLESWLTHRHCKYALIFTDVKYEDIDKELVDLYKPTMRYDLGTDKIVEL